MLVQFEVNILRYDIERVNKYTRTFHYVDRLTMLELLSTDIATMDVMLQCD